MARIVVLGAGVSGHTAALHLRRRLGKAHDVIVVSPNSQWNWIPSTIWVGVGRMGADTVVFPLEPIYAARASPTTRPRPSPSAPGVAADPTGAVDIVYTSPRRRANRRRCATTT